jgi:hypothetical protein
MTRSRRRPSPALLVACLALFVALGGPAQAQKLLVGSGDLKEDAVTSRAIRDGAVRSKELRTGAVASGDVRDRSLRVQDLGRGAVGRLTATSPGSVGELQLLDGAVTAPKLAASSVTTGAIALGAVTGANIQDGTIGVDDLGRNSVGDGKIRNGTIGKEDIGRQAVGVQELAGTSGAGVIPGGTPVTGGCTAGVDVAVAPAPAAQDSVGVLDDVVLGGRTQAWPAEVALRVQPVAPGTVRAFACTTAGPTISGDLPFTVLTIAA